VKVALIVADQAQKYYYDPFVSACEEKGVRLHVLDPTRFPSEAAISIRLDDSGRVMGFVDVLECHAAGVKEKRLRVEEINTAWYLRASKPVPTTVLSELEARFSQNESSRALDALLSTIECRWINRKETIRFLESNKLYQQFIAQKCGLATPETLISNDPASVLALAHEKEDLLLKTLGYTELDKEGKYFIYSQLFRRDDLVGQDKAIQACPVFAQEYVKKRYEYRVMVIGAKVLACRIDSQSSEATRVDWRHYDFENVEHVQVELPIAIQRNLLRFMKRVGLQYGAIDLIETPGGDFVFLEVNPSGQWEWIVVLAGLPIPQAVADMLATA